MLFVDMFGYDDQRRLAAGDALLGLLQALGMPGEHIPASEQDRGRLFRSVLAAYAAHGRRLLLIIDNASTAAQVTPLLPGDDSTAILITSRHTLAVGARLPDLDVFDLDASVRLIANELRQAHGPADTRVEDDPQAAVAIAELCAGLPLPLPLALRIAAAHLAGTEPHEADVLLGDLARAADTHLKPPPVTVAARFPSRAEALAWLETERPNLIAAWAFAATHRDTATSIQLALALARFLDLGRYFDEAVTVYTKSAELLRHTGDRREAFTDVGDRDNVTLVQQLLDGLDPAA